MLLQVLLIEKGGEFTKTSGLDIYQWLICIGLGALSLVVGWLMRWLPVKEDPASFFSHGDANEPTTSAKGRQGKHTATDAKISP